MGVVAARRTAPAVQRKRDRNGVRRMLRRNGYIKILLCLFFFGQFLPGATAPVEPDVFDTGAESLAVAVRVKSVQARSLRPAPRDGRTRTHAAFIRREAQALADPLPKAQSPSVMTFLPRRFTSDVRSPHTPTEDH